jgi:hypothetical protein
MAPRPIKPVEPLKDFAAVFVVVADGEVEVEVEVEVVFDDDEVEDVPVVVVVIGTEKKDKVGCPDARLQNSCPRDSIVDTWSGQFANTQSRSRVG